MNSYAIYRNLYHTVKYFSPENTLHETLNKIVNESYALGGKEVTNEVIKQVIQKYI